MSAYDPESLSVVPLPPDVASRLSRFAEAGHTSTPISPEETATWESLQDLLSKAPLPDTSNPDETISQLVLSNTYHCNMGCTYCYNELDMKPVKGSQSPVGMEWSTAQAAIDAVFVQLPAGRSLKLFFIGGEPLLEKKLMFTALAYAEDVASRAGCTVKPMVYTNGTLITSSVLDWVKDHKVSVITSLDGPGGLNDARTYLSGRPTTKIVLRNLKRLLETGTQAPRRIRAVSTATTPLVALHRYFLALGFNEIHVQPMYDDQGIESAPQDDMLGLLDWYTRLLLEGTVLDVMPFSGYFQKLIGAGSLVSSWHPCTAGRNAMTVGPDGRIYSCHHAIEEDSFTMGNVAAGMPELSQRRGFYRSVQDRSACAKCWAKHVCGGECYHRSTTAGLDAYDVIPDVCRTRKTLIGASIDAFAEVASRNPSALLRLASGDLTVPDINDWAYQAETLQPFH